MSVTLYNLELTEKELTVLMRKFVEIYTDRGGKLTPPEMSVMTKLKRLKDGK